MDRQLINERFVTHGTILESKEDKLPAGVLARVKYPIGNIDKPNKNKRIYRKGVYERVISDPEVQASFANRNAWMQEEHPEDTANNPAQATKTDRIAGIVTDMSIEKDPADGVEKAYITSEVLNTPMGRIIFTLLQAKCGIGVSTRAQGELQECDHEGEKMSEVVADSYKYITTDYTADPSTYGALPENVELAMCENIKEGVASNKISKEYATKLLESMKTPGAKVLCEPFKKDEGKKLNEMGGQAAEPMQPVGSAHFDFGALLDQFMRMPEAELLGGESVKALNEATTPVDFVKVLRKGIREIVTERAIESAKVAVLTEAVEKEAARYASLSENYAGDVIEYAKKMHSLKEQTVEKMKVLMAKTADAVVARLNEKHKVDIANERVKASKEVEKIKKDLLESARKQVEEIRSNAREVNEKTMMDALQKFYVEPKLARIRESGHKLPENAVALLRQSKTVQEADAAFGRLHVALKEGVLHSNMAKKEGGVGSDDASVSNKGDEAGFDYTGWF